MKEEWKEIDWIPGVRSIYAISTFGRIKRVGLIRHLHKKDTYQLVRKERMIHPTDNGHGYKIISFQIMTDKGLKRKNFYMHRLVATAFIPNPDNKPEVNHIDFDRSNNNVSNLEWVTDIENVRHSAPNFKHPIKYDSGIRFKDSKYEVSVYHDNKSYYVGRFWDFEDALEARNNKLKELGVTKYVGESA